VEAHASGARDYSAPLWTLLMFDAFLKNVMEGDGRIFQEKAAG
jgi:asparagine synthase (glutamine-hydrolysing)